MWYGSILDRLSAHEARVPDRKLAGLLARSLSDRSVLTRFLSLAPLALEQNMEIMPAYRFHRWQLERMAEVGREIERRNKKLGRGDGLRVLHRIQLLAAAVQPFADPRGSLAVNLIDPDFAELRIDMETEISAEVERFLAALAS